MPQEAIRLYEKSAVSAKEIRDAIKEEGLERDYNAGVLDVWYNTDEDEIRLNLGDWTEEDVRKQWRDALAGCCSTMSWADEAGGPDEGFVSVWHKPTIGKNAWISKEAYSPFLRGVGQTMQMIPSSASKYIPGSPSPIASMVAGGLLGAGLGYGGGWVGEQLFPEKWKKNKLRRTLMMLGGMAGMIPGGVWGMTNRSMDKNFNDPSLLNHPPVPNSGYSSDSLLAADSPTVLGDNYQKEVTASALPAGFRLQNWPSQPAQSYIPVEEVTQTTLYDPRVAARLSSPVQAVTAAVVQGASHLNNGARFITPMDMGKITAGMGSGYLSGMIVGKVLGALTGMPATTQNRLKSTGMWAGMLANTAPLMFPRYG